MPPKKKFEYKYPNEGRWDHRRDRWITAEEDFMQMVKKGSFPDGRKPTPQQSWDCFKKVADEDVPGLSQFCKYILSGVDRP